MSDTQVANLAPIAGLTSLHGFEDHRALIVLQVSNQPLPDLAPLQGATVLAYVGFYDTTGGDLRGLAGLPALQRVWANHVAVDSLMGLGGHADLRQISVAEGRFT